MSHLRALRQELFKYHKRKKRFSDGSVPGIPYQGSRRFRTAGFTNSNTAAGQYHHDLYMADIPTQYRPDMFSPAVDWKQYRCDDEEFTQMLKTPEVHHSFDRTLHENSMPAASTDELTVTEQFLMNTGISPRPQEETITTDFEDIRHLFEGVRAPLHVLGSQIVTGSEQEINFEEQLQDRFDNTENESDYPDLDQITQTLNFLANSLPHNHPDIINLRQAQKELVQQQIGELHQDTAFWQQYESEDDWQSNLGTGNPYENDDLASMQDIQENDIAQDAEMIDQIAHDGPSLDNMVENEFDAFSAEPEMNTNYDAITEISPVNTGGVEAMTDDPFEQINQAIDQATQFEQPQMDPWKQQYDPYLQMEMMMDMQMQYMANPFQMPGQIGF